VALKVALDPPAGATAFSFDWKYFSLDYPEWVCSQYVDNAGVFVNGANVLNFHGHPVSANTVMEVCESGATGFGQGAVQSSHVCPNDPSPASSLQGTGFHEPIGARMHGGSSEWHTTTVPVMQGSTYTVIFGIWDSVDGTLKSTVLFDNWQWSIATPTPTPSPSPTPAPTPPGATPAPTPAGAATPTPPATPGGGAPTVTAAPTPTPPEGATPTPPDGATPTPTATPVAEGLQGDADCNGVVNSVDALHVLREVAGLGAAACIERGDVNCDGARTSVDALGILRFVAVLPPLTAPPGCPAVGQPLG
jgi:hypothetical protein